MVKRKLLFSQARNNLRTTFLEKFKKLVINLLNNSIKVHGSFILIKKVQNNYANLKELGMEKYYLIRNYTMIFPFQMDALCRLRNLFYLLILHLEKTLNT